MENIKTYDDFLNEELNLKKIALGIGLFAILGVAGCNYPDIAYNISHNKSVPKGTRLSTDAKIINVREYPFGKGGTRSRVMLAVGERNVYYVIVDSGVDLKKGDIVYFRLEKDGDGYIKLGEDVYTLVTFSIDSDDVGGSVSDIISCD